MRILHVASEIFPLVKTGGLADVAAALPPATGTPQALAKLTQEDYQRWGKLVQERKIRAD